MKKEKASRPDYQLKNCLLWLFVWPYADNFFCFFVFKQTQVLRVVRAPFILYLQMKHKGEALRDTSGREIEKMKKEEPVGKNH